MVEHRQEHHHHHTIMIPKDSQINAATRLNPNATQPVRPRTVSGSSSSNLTGPLIIRVMAVFCPSMALPLWHTLSMPDLKGRYGWSGRQMFKSEMVKVQIQASQQRVHPLLPTCKSDWDTNDLSVAQRVYCLRWFDVGFEAVSSNCRFFAWPQDGPHQLWAYVDPRGKIQATVIVRTRVAGREIVMGMNQEWCRSGYNGEN